MAVTQAELDYWREEDRRKAQFDHNTLVNAARRVYLEEFEKGRAEAYAEEFEKGLSLGVQVGTIHACERFLNRPETPRSQLYGLALSELTRLANDLQAQLPKFLGQPFRATNTGQSQTPADGVRPQPVGDKPVAIS
jgi:flagellar biosynthesis/type III secretory pathway protein FliH